MEQKKKSLREKFVSGGLNAELLLLLVAFIWGTSFPLTKISLDYISPVFLVFLRFAITTVLFYIVYRKQVKVFQFSEWKNGAILGFLLFAGFVSQTVGIGYTSASNSAFITGTNLIMIPFVQYFLLKVKPKKENFIGIIIVIIGLYFLADAFNNSMNFGDLITLLCALAFAIHIVFLDKYLKHDKIINLIFGQFLSMSVFTLVFFIVYELLIIKSFLFNPTVPVISILLYVSIVGTLFVFIIVTKYQGKTTPVRAGIIYNMEQVFAVIFAFIILNERLSLMQIAGGCIMITGLFISELTGFLRSKQKITP
ncbi:DMT family transporter [soil metagenome]